MSPSYSELLAFVFDAFTIVCFHENGRNKTWNEFCAIGTYQSLNSLTHKHDFYHAVGHAVFIFQLNMK